MTRLSCGGVWCELRVVERGVLGRHDVEGGTKTGKPTEEILWKDRAGGGREGRRVKG